VRLLRVLQEKEIERVGGVKTIRVDIRIIAATHRNLETMITQNRFREDLFYRLKVFPIVIPPLRERITDIPALVQYFIQKKARDMKLTTTPTLAYDAIDDLMAYHWPGNVRELENAVERALILSQGKPLTFDFVKTSQNKTAPPVIADTEGEVLNLNLTIARQIRKALAASNGKVHGKGGTAELLGLNPGTLRHKMKKLGIPFGRKVKKEENKN
jgi:transcriptional regulator with GAF, ATPase, and Fis domain